MTTVAEKKLAERESAAAKTTEKAKEVEKEAAVAQAPKPEVEDEGRDENVGKPRGRDIDPTFHDEYFVDPNTGEVIENIPVVHDVAVGVNKDGSLKYERADKVMFAQVSKKK